MVKNVLIVGGGAAGWMTASYLRKALNEHVTITVLESPDIATVGVGEATFSTIKLFFDYLGLHEHQWMPHCNATYKMAIRFENWTSKKGHFYHPFQRYEVVDGFNLGEWWLKLKRGEEPFDYACFSTPTLCDTQRSPRHLDGTVFDEKVRDTFTAEHIARRNVLADHTVQYPYAYHFDASLLAAYLCKYATRLGVSQIRDKVIDVALKDDGGIAHVQTEKHGPVSADFFIDCTGFRGLLINKALGEPFIGFESLLCDSAVAMQVPVDIEQNGINPYTTATAMSSGWIWNIPLYGRVGTGYVYSGKYISKEDAEKEFRAHLGPASAGCKPNHIKMRIGRNRNSWVKNCVAIGLSSGFVEPLESTGIFFIQHGIEELVSHFETGAHDERMVKSYNDSIAECIDGVRDFLTLHYRTTDRADNEFWRAARSVEVPERLREKLDLWKMRLPNPKNVNPSYHGFEFYSYSVMLLGLNYRPATNLPVLDCVDPANALATFDQLRVRTEHLAKSLPSQYEYLTHMRKKASQEGSRPSSGGSVDVRQRSVPPDQGAPP